MVIISSFYNEEYLLPWWLKHHKDIFEHGVLFNYFSTDKSVSIIKKICPTWEVRDTSNKDWDFPANDREYMDAEKEFDEYKIVLTTTEFLFGNLPKLPKRKTAYSIPFVRLVDDEPEKLPTYNKPLIEQKHTAYVEKSDWNKKRYLHNYPYGQYGVGRHNTKLKTTDISMQIYKYVYSPWNEKFIKRKLQMKDYVNPENTKKNMGLHHVWDRKKLKKEYTKALKHSYRI